MAYNFPLSTEIGDKSKDIVFEFEFEFTSNPNLFVRADVSVKEAFESLTTGLLKNCPVSRVKLLTVAEGNSSVYFTYDVNAAKKGNQPWSLLLTTL